MKFKSWVYAPEALPHIPEGSVGGVLNERTNTVQVCWFTISGVFICVLPKVYVLPYDINRELEDLNELMMQAQLINDQNWIKDLQLRYDLLNSLCADNSQSSNTLKPFKLGG